MSDKSTAETEEHKRPSDAATEALVAAERRRMIDRVLTHAALREQAAIMPDKAASENQICDALHRHPRCNRGLQSVG